MHIQARLRPTYVLSDTIALACVQVQDSVVVTEAALGVRPVLPAGYGSGFEAGGWPQ